MHLQAFARWVIRIVGPDMEILTLIVNGLTLYRVNPKTDKALQCAIEDLELE